MGVEDVRDGAREVLLDLHSGRARRLADQRLAHQREVVPALGGSGLWVGVRGQCPRFPESVVGLSSSHNVFMS